MGKKCFAATVNPIGKNIANNLYLQPINTKKTHLTFLELIKSLTL